jgi:hypothetical protein
MNNPASSAGSIDVLALTLPYIPRQTYPIIHPVAQVGLSRLNYYADPQGLLVLLGPYVDQEANETGRLYLNGFPQPLSTDITKDSTTPLEFRLPVGMLSNGINTLKVSVQRQSGNEDSAELIVLHYLAVPAANDPDPTPGNSLLSIDVTPKSIGPTEAAAGVIVTLDYPGKQLYDTLTVDVGGKSITHQIVPTSQDPTPETRPIILTLYAADFIHAPNNPQFVFKYSASNQVGDYSGVSLRGAFNPEKFWSKDHVVDVHLDRAELEMPILQEILGDNGDDPTIVDLDKMKGGPLWALIHLIPSIWQAGDQIHLMFEALVGGAVVASHELTLPIRQVPSQLSLDIPNFKVVANSQLRVKYEQLRAGNVIAVSMEALAQVVGQGLPDIEDFESTPSQGATEVGQSVSTSKIKITLTGKVNPNDSLAIGRFVDEVDANGQAFYGYLGQPNGQITSLSYEVELIGRTANRLLIWIAGGNIIGSAAQMNLVFRDATGATLNIVNRVVTPYQRQQQIDTGVLNNIKSIAVVVNGQVIIDRIQFL